jgi:hypothetical protein
MHFGFMNLILICRDLRHVSGSHVAILKRQVQDHKYIHCKKQIYLYYCTYRPEDGNMRGRNLSVVAK